MRILQLIDSLEAGGAERLAVNLANVLAGVVDESHLIATRTGGDLQQSIGNSVKYCCLDRQSTVDGKAFKAFSNYIKKHNIQVVHAHSSSYFFAVITRMFYVNFKLVWHNHNGESRIIGWKKTTALKLFARSFDQVINVNEDLNDWVINNIGVTDPIYLRNFSILPARHDYIKVDGVAGSRIVSLANLRYQKNIIFLLKAFDKVLQHVPVATLHLVGKDAGDEYSKEIKSFIAAHQLADHVLIYGSRKDTFDLLDQMDIAVLASQIEGLPVSLLEYGMAQLPVVVTDVGACKEVVGDRGMVVESNNVDQLTDALLNYLNNPERRTKDASRFHHHIVEKYGSEQYLNELLPIYNGLVQRT
ncbi:MAG: glycosyltransferase [Nonlabens sp.]